MIASTKDNESVQKERQPSVPFKPTYERPSGLPEKLELQPLQPIDQRQLSKDRRTALLVLLVMAAIFGFIIWLAAHAPPHPDSSLYEPWMMW